MTTYIVMRKDGTVLDRGLSIEEAAHAVLTYDGYRYVVAQADDIRETEGDATYCVYAGSLSGDWPSVKCRGLRWVSAGSAAEAWPEIARDVIARCGEWRRSPDVMTDADYDAMVASLAAEEAEE